MNKQTYEMLSRLQDIGILPADRLELRRACNAHDALVAALRELDGAIEAEENGNAGSIKRARVKVNAALKLARGES